MLKGLSYTLTSQSSLLVFGNRKILNINKKSTMTKKNNFSKAENSSSKKSVISPDAESKVAKLNNPRAINSRLRSDIVNNLALTKSIVKKEPHNAGRNSRYHGNINNVVFLGDKNE